MLSVSDLLWLWLGDFNDLLSLENKKVGNPYPGYLFKGFRDVIASCHLMDIPFHDYPFTWEEVMIQICGSRMFG